jgi:predicted MPP superfamily phosphohydrolase
VAGTAVVRGSRRGRPARRRGSKSPCREFGGASVYYESVKHRSLRRALSIALLVVLGLSVYAVVIEPSRLQVNHYELEIPKWPAALSGTRVAFLSDLHIGSPFWDIPRLEQVVRRVNAEEPDLVLLGGDYSINDIVGGKFVAIEPIAAELGRLRARLGVFAVLGNHDWWNDGARTRAALEANGIRVLDDQAARIDAVGGSFCLLGMTDQVVRTRSAAQSLALALPGLPLLALVHEPDIFSQMDERAALTLAGHTHGGQVRLPLLGRPIVPSSFGQRYAAGHIVEKGRHLFVTTGLGTSILPIRFGVPPEVALLTLRAQSPASRALAPREPQ